MGNEPASFGVSIMCCWMAGPTRWSSGSFLPAMEPSLKVEIFGWSIPGLIATILAGYNNGISPQLKPSGKRLSEAFLLLLLQGSAVRGSLRQMSQPIQGSRYYLSRRIPQVCYRPLPVLTALHFLLSSRE